MINIFINNRYKIVDKLAVGGFCTIYKAKDIYDEYFNNNRYVAIKVPNKEFFKKNDINDFLYMEYKILRKLSKDSIVKVYDFGIDNFFNFPYIVLEYLEGKLLNQINLTNLKLQDKQKLSKKLKKTLKYIHKKNIIHADISMNNIMICENRVVLFDFGASIDLNDSFKLDYNVHSIVNNDFSSENIKNLNIPTFNCDKYSLSLILEKINCTN